MKISIITVCYNSAATIRDTLKSIALQDHPDIEHIIIDGKSSDNTLELVREFPHVSIIISEKDNGLYEAMNKGVLLATGDVVGILNSDDVYAHKNVLSKISALFNDTVTDTVYGDLQYVDAANMNKVIRHWRSGDFKRSKFYFGWMPPHPSFFMRKKVYDKVGLFNCSLRSAADYEIMLRVLLKYRFNSVYIPEVLVKMRTGGVSNSSLRHRIRANKEDRLAWRLNNIQPYFFTIPLKPLRKIAQFFIK